MTTPCQRHVHLARDNISTSLTQLLRGCRRRKSKKVYEQILAHPRGSISAMGKDGTWLRLYADFIPEDDAALNDQLLEEYPALKPMYKGGDGNCTLLRLDNIQASLCSFTNAPRVLM